MASIGVIYLYRFAEGEVPARTFLDSYCARSADIEHDLHVILKGFPDEKSHDSARALFDRARVNLIELDDTGYDIGSYVYNMEDWWSSSTFRSDNQENLMISNNMTRKIIMR